MLFHFWSFILKRVMNSVNKIQQWIHPFTAIVAGPTGSGKTVFVQNFIKHSSAMCDTRFDRILFYYGEWQSGYDEKFDRLVEFHVGVPDPRDFSDDPRAKLIIIDDLMRESSNNKNVVDIFTKGSHHKNISVIFITQNIFHQGKSSRDLSLNAGYLILYKNPRDRAQIQHLARQVYPENPKFLVESFTDATSKPHTYLLIDLRQSTPEQYRIRSCIFPTDRQAFFYVPR